MIMTKNKNLLNIRISSELSGLHENTIRKYITEQKLTKYTDDKNHVLVDKQELLDLVPVVLTIFSKKGGCGKTSLSVLLADYYEKKNKKVLLVSLDPQCNLDQTFFNDLFLVEKEEKNHNINKYFSFKMKSDDQEKPLSDMLGKLIVKVNNNIDILLSSESLSNNQYYDIRHFHSFEKDFRALFKKYQIVIVDCPPTDNSYSNFGLILANYVIMPFFADLYDYKGLQGAIKIFLSLVKYMNEYKSHKVLLGNYEYTNIQENYIDIVKEQLGDLFIPYYIPKFKGVKERADVRQNIFETYKNDFGNEKSAIYRINKVLDYIDNYIYANRQIEYQVDKSNINIKKLVEISKDNDKN